jgi:hypothetical protein
MSFDVVEKPVHYNQGSIDEDGRSKFEPIKMIRSRHPDAEFWFCIGNAQKYIQRSGVKGSTIQDLEKAIWYLKRAKECRVPIGFFDEHLLEDAVDSNTACAEDFKLAKNLGRALVKMHIASFSEAILLVQEEIDEWRAG